MSPILASIVFSLILLILLSPVFLILAILIKFSSPGPVFFKQKRVGTNNVEFEIYKFRSMTVQDQKKSDTIWTTANDNRVTLIGKFMRKTNLDELPQLWNVVLGNMSIVGPRPEREHFVEKFKKENSIQLDLTNLDSGIYYIMIINKDNIYSEKLIIE